MNNLKVKKAAYLRHKLINDVIVIKHDNYPKINT